MASACSVSRPSCYPTGPSPARQGERKREGGKKKGKEKGENVDLAAEGPELGRFWPPSLAESLRRGRGRRERKNDLGRAREDHKGEEMDRVPFSSSLSFNISRGLRFQRKEEKREKGRNDSAYFCARKEKGGNVRRRPPSPLSLLYYSLLHVVAIQKGEGGEKGRKGGGYGRSRREKGSFKKERKEGGKTHREQASAARPCWPADQMHSAACPASLSKKKRKKKRGDEAAVLHPEGEATTDISPFYDHIPPPSALHEDGGGEKKKPRSNWACLIGGGK